MEEEKIKYQLVKNKKTALIVLLATIYLAFICLMIGQVQAITDFSYRIHELLFLPVNVAMFIVPIQVIVYIYYVVRSWGTESRQVTWVYRTKKYLILLSLVLIFGVLYIGSFNSNVGGIIKIYSKVQRENNYYITVSVGREIECTRNEYKLLKENEEYLASYQWNSYLGKGSLETIEPINRGK